MSTHILPEVQATCSRVLIINGGELVADDAPENLVAAGGRIEVELVPRGEPSVRGAEVRDSLLKLPGVQDVVASPPSEDGALAYTLRVGAEDPRKALFDFAVESGLVLIRLERHKVSLEETFRRLTTKETVKENAKDTKANA
jgi:ABC-2 type transport system ATP-binding protein